MVSAVHAFEGRPQEGARPDPEPVGRDEVEVHAELGIVGDRYYNQKVHKNAAVTFLAAESLDQLAADLELSRSNVSNHLSCLRGCGLVVAGYEGRQVRYEIADAHLARALRELVQVVLAVEPRDACEDEVVAR